MSLPSADRIDPREQAKTTALRGRFHDVVVAASKVVHGQDLTDRDMEALRWARDQLEAAASKDVLFAMPSSDQLSGSGSTITALRRAAQPDGGDPEEALDRLRKSLIAVLKGVHDEAAIQAMDSLRAIYAMVSRLALQAEVVAQGELSSPTSSWETLTTTLSS